MTLFERYPFQTAAKEGAIFALKVVSAPVMIPFAILGLIVLYYYEKHP